ncbi:MAG TPA: transposase, partial [Flavobacteriaceae bacterium]|nr:transposase [Flavobacteriaceae bacterium]
MFGIAQTKKCGEMLILDVWSAGQNNLSDYKYLVACIDPVCRKVNVRPLKENNSDEIARFLIEEAFNPSFPKSLLTDRGSSVSSKHITELLTAINCGIDERNKAKEEDEIQAEGIRHHLSTPYNPLGHSQIERFFSTFGQSLRRCIREHPQNWHLFAGRIAQVVNNTRCRATGFSPNHLHLGIKPSESFPDIFNTLQDSPPETRSKFIQDRVKEITIARDLAFKNNEQYFNVEDQQWKRKYSPTRKHNYQPGEYVLVKRISRTGENADKLSKLPAFLGPALVKALIGSKAVLLEFVVNGEIRLRSFRHLARFVPPPEGNEHYQKYYNGPKTKSKLDVNKY